MTTNKEEILEALNRYTSLISLIVFARTGIVYLEQLAGENLQGPLLFFFSLRDRITSSELNLAAI